MRLTPSDPNSKAELSAVEVRWVLSMIADAVVHGMRVAADDLPGPHDQGGMWMEPLTHRWAQLVDEASDADDVEDYLWGLRDDVAERSFQHAAYFRVEDTGTDTPKLLPSTWQWLDAIGPTDWERAPGVAPVPDVSELSVEWLGNAVFEYARRLGIAALKDRPAAFGAAEHVLVTHGEFVRMNVLELSDAVGYRAPLDSSSFQD
jgi:hypothetical protein